MNKTKQSNAKQQSCTVSFDSSWPPSLNVLNSSHLAPFLKLCNMLNMLNMLYNKSLEPVLTSPETMSHRYPASKVLHNTWPITHQKLTPAIRFRRFAILIALGLSVVAYLMSLPFPTFLAHLNILSRIGFSLRLIAFSQSSDISPLQIFPSVKFAVFESPVINILSFP